MLLQTSPAPQTPSPFHSRKPRRLQCLLPALPEVPAPGNAKLGSIKVPTWPRSRVRGQVWASFSGPSLKIAVFRVLQGFLGDSSLFRDCVNQNVYGISLSLSLIRWARRGSISQWRSSMSHLPAAPRWVFWPNASKRYIPRAKSTLTDYLKRFSSRVVKHVCTALDFEAFSAPLPSSVLFFRTYFLQNHCF